MTLQEHLANLRKINSLISHTATPQEIKQHLSNARERIKDAKNTSVSNLGRFDAAYGASHALLTAALKMKGYRTGDTKGHRYLLFELLEQLVPQATSAKYVLAQAHILRNKNEYDAAPIDVSKALISSMLESAEKLDKFVSLDFESFMKQIEFDSEPESKPDYPRIR